MKKAKVKRVGSKFYWYAYINDELIAKSKGYPNLREAMTQGLLVLAKDFVWEV